MAFGPSGLPGLEAAGNIGIGRIGRRRIDAIQEDLHRRMALFQAVREIRRDDDDGIGLAGIHQGGGLTYGRYVVR